MNLLLTLEYQCEIIEIPSLNQFSSTNNVSMPNLVCHGAWRSVHNQSVRSCNCQSYTIKRLWETC